MRKIRVTAMDEDTAELLDEVKMEVSDDCTKLTVVNEQLGDPEATLSIGVKL